MNNTTCRGIARVAIALIASTVLSISLRPAYADDASGVRDYSIQPQSLDSALIEFSKQADRQVIGASDSIKDRRTTGVLGRLSITAALDKLLSGTGLSYEIVGEHSVRIVSRGHKTSDASSAPNQTLAGDKTDLPVVHFDIPAKDLDQALEDFRAQSGLTVVAPSTLTAGKKASSVRGDFTPSDALVRLLEGSGLTFARATDGTIAIHAISTRGPVRASTGESGSKKGSTESDQLEEVVVTGTHLNLSPGEASQRVQVFTREQIEQSGQTQIAGFLNTLSDVSVGSTQAVTGQVYGSTTVQLHGLPIGTTLVLLNGRRVEGSASQSGAFFDLNNIPIFAVERIEVISEGSSAVYGSDAIGGVVNIVLRDKVDGIEASAQGGGAIGTRDYGASIAAGRSWEHAGLSVIANFQSQGDLLGYDRAITSNADFRRFGGPDGRFAFCNPGNVVSADGTPLPGLGGATYAAVPKGFRGIPSTQEFVAGAGSLNLCSDNTAGGALIPTTQHTGLLAAGHYDLSPQVKIFSEVMYSHVALSQPGPPNPLPSLPTLSYSQYTIGAMNPYNPFGTTVGVAGLLTGTNQNSAIHTDYVRALVGGKGEFAERWDWEVAVWESGDNSIGTSDTLNSIATQIALNSTDPSTALNPFVDGPYGSPQLLQSLGLTVGYTYSLQRQDPRVAVSFLAPRTVSIRRMPPASRPATASGPSH